MSRRYFGWNVTLAGFHKSQNCDYTVEYAPFATTRQARIQNADPRPSLEERYGTHDSYAQTVQAAAANAVAQGFLLQADALVAAAQASQVLKSARSGSEESLAWSAGAINALISPEQHWPSSFSVVAVRDPAILPKVSVVGARQRRFGTRLREYCRRNGGEGGGHAMSIAG
jgi:alpha/beta hydrolase family protein